MATLAGMMNRFFDRGMEAGAEAPRARQDAARVRPFANEDIYFFVKEINNAGVVRAADPQSGGVCWKMIGSVVAAAVLLVGVLLPGAYSLLAGYQIQELKQEAQRLQNERASLELEEAQLISPARMEQLAKEQQFIDPPAQKVVYLDGSRNGSLAMNK
jgi:cell division protein FtsL